MIERFPGPQAKLERAKHHIADLRSRIENFLAEGKHRLVTEMDPQSGQDILRIEKNEAIPQDWALILGDAAHNLMSSLDVMASALVRRRGRSISGVVFPTANSEGGFKTVLQREKIRKAGPEVRTELNRIQPYLGGNGEFIRHLHDLDIADKHHLVLPVSGIAELTEWSTGNVRMRGGKIVFDQAWPQLIGPQGAFAPNNSAGAQKIKFQGTIVIVFGKGEAFASEPIIETLEKVTAKVGEIIKQLEPYLE